jgi:hypothetical protein
MRGLTNYSPFRARERKSMTPEYAGIQRLLDAVHAACRADYAARTSSTRLAVRAAKNELNAARAAMRACFAAEHGWVYSERIFTLDQLRRGSTQARRGDYDFRALSMEHLEYFRISKRPWRPAVILSHEYGPFESSQAIALKQGLTATLLTTSWYSPDRANAVLYTGQFSVCR